MDERVTVNHFRKCGGSIPSVPTPWDLVDNAIADQDWDNLDFYIREAQASCALDGDTQSFPIPNVMVFRRLPTGKLDMTYEYHPDFPHRREAR